MKITGFDIERFGLWSGLSVPKLFPGINVFFGANEAGKSTLMEFIRTVLYGFGEDRRRYARKPGSIHIAWNADVDHEGRSLYTTSGGILNLNCPSGDYRLERVYRPDKPGHEDQVDLKTLDGAKQGVQLLRVLVSGVDETTFNNVFAIGLDELQRLGSLNDTEAAEMLFRLSVGMDRVSIVEAIKELANRRNKILNSSEKNHKPSQLLKMLRQREKLLEELGNAKLLVRDYARIRTEQRSVDRIVAQIESDLAELQREKRHYEIARQSEPIWNRRDKLRRDIEAMGNVAAVPDSVITQLDALNGEVGKKKFAYDKLKEEYKRALAAIKNQPVSETLRKQAPKLEFLLDEEKRIVEIDREISELEAGINGLEGQVIERESQIKRGNRLVVNPTITTAAKIERKPTGNSKFPVDGMTFAPDGSTVITTPVSLSSGRNVKLTPDIEELLPGESFEDFRVPAKHLVNARKQLSQAKDAHADITAKAKEVNDKINSELAKHGATNISEAVEKASDMVSHLRRRQGLAGRIAELGGQYRELSRINAFLVEHQTLPVIGDIIVGACVVLGLIPVGIVFFQLLGVETYDINPALVILGLIAAFGGGAYKIFTERTNAEKLQHNQRQLGMLLSQLDQVKQDAGAIDVKYPPVANMPLEVRLEEAQTNLTHLEKLIPVEAQKRDFDQQLKEAETELEHSKSRHASASKRWNDWLKMAGLPADWTPPQIRDWLDHHGVVDDLKKDLDRRYDTMNQRIREMRTITDRIDRMMLESGLTFPDGMSYVDILGEIRKKLEANDAAIAQREKLKKGMKQFKSLRKKAVGDLHLARENEAELLRQYGCKVGDDLRNLHQRHITHKKLLQQEQGVQRELDAAIGGFCDEPKIGTLLEPRLERKVLERLAAAGNDTAALRTIDDLPTLDQLILNVQKRIDATAAKLHVELELRGRLGEQLKTLADDKTAIRKQRELAILDDKIQKARFEWQTYAASTKMLDVIRATYERERQPRTLAEASELLRRLTDGKYHRIWTPLGEETLMVDDEKGQSFDVSWLSRGTREQLFIALRLALASAFAQSGTILPLILDDVLVNFDSKRALAAAKVLIEVAKTGRQIFLFTCHEHVCRIFQKLEVPVRLLPSIDHPGETTKILLPYSILKKREQAKRREAERLEAERSKLRIERELNEREEQIRLEAVRKAEIQRLILQMQQQATAEKAVEAELKITHTDRLDHGEKVAHAADRPFHFIVPKKPEPPIRSELEDFDGRDEWWDDTEAT